MTQLQETPLPEFAYQLMVGVAYEIAEEAKTDYEAAQKRYYEHVNEQGMNEATAEAFNRLIVSFAAGLPFEA